MTDYKNILIPVDFSDTNEIAIRRAINIANDQRCNLCAIHVFDYLAPPHFDTDLPNIYEHIKDITELAEKKLSALIASFSDRKNIKIVVEVGRISARLIEFIDENSIDLVVVGNHSSGTLRGLLGSVPSKLANHSPCDVLIVKS